MSRYEARQERDLGQIRDQLTNLAEAVQTAVETATLALFSGDHELSYNACLADHPINRASRALDKTCLGFIAVHLPSAGHLRFVSAVMHVNIELERIGDYAKTISRESVQLDQPPVGAIRGQLEQVSMEARSILQRAVTAFVDGNADEARAGIRAASAAGRQIKTGFTSIVDEEGSASVRELLCHLVILNSFDRIIDQAKNTCEEAIFAVTGETKAPKSYRVLFLDEDNSILGPMAQAISQRNHPQSGQYDTAGRQAADAFQEGLGPYLEDRGIETQSTSPQTLDPALDLVDYHVIVSLQGSVTDYIDTVPFATIALNWDLEAQLPEDPADRLESLYRCLAPQLRDLMVTLRGEETSSP
ncbi:MAG: hypothetical protein HN712_25320 [Gemmatimonadetes bacterium]|nr:hypothetical protein [Gemmatimonadota bacterium]